MATYEELYDLQNNGDLQHKVAVALVIAAEAILKETPPDGARTKWAGKVIAGPLAVARQAMFVVLAANKTADVQQIIDATDPAIQANVDAAIDGLVKAGE